MTVRDIFELRRQGRIEEAYKAVRQLYAADKGPSVAVAMFWTAVDVFRKRMGEGRTAEAEIILLALERMQSRVPDKEGAVEDALKNCHRLLEEPAPAKDLTDHSQTGKWGEELAMEYLREKGYIILDHDWHSGHRDIDVIAEKDGVVVFVEVKTRRNNDYMDPAMAVNYRKQHNLRMAINHYVKLHKLDSPIRFDVISIVGGPGYSHPEIEHIEDFQLSVR